VAAGIPRPNAARSNTSRNRCLDSLPPNFNERARFAGGNLAPILASVCVRKRRQDCRIYWGDFFGPPAFLPRHFPTFLAE
jgi:hypothetical protein